MASPERPGWSDVPHEFELVCMKKCSTAPATVVYAAHALLQERQHQRSRSRNGAPVVFCTSVRCCFVLSFVKVARLG